MYDRIREYAAIRPTDTVYDLYSGTGSISLYLARDARHVLGIETLPQAVDDARYNARLNEVNNVSFVQGDAKDLFNDALVEKYGRPDVLVVDPPREGLHVNVTEQMLRLLPRRIVYVSCNPATQARDLALMKNFYDISLIHPVDMFPQTHHVENIAVLDRKA
jgi:23S rRNA (uracil1939-C5)-methyltransferase